LPEVICNTSPQRRVDTPLMFLSKGAYAATFKRAKSSEAALADEIISAANRDVKSYAINQETCYGSLGIIIGG
jgi:small subunit ribosomal protein S7